MNDYVAAGYGALVVILGGYSWHLVHRRKRLMSIGGFSRPGSRPSDPGYDQQGADNE